MAALLDAAAVVEGGQWRDVPATCLSQGLSTRSQSNDFASSYTLGRELGRGSYSVVFQAMRAMDGSSWAVKVMHKARFARQQKVLQRLRSEMIALTKLQHPNIIGLAETFETPSHLLLIMEVAHGGELFERIVSHGNFSEDEAAAVIRQLLQVLHFMHSRGVMHRDIKPEVRAPMGNCSYRRSVKST